MVCGQNCEKTSPTIVVRPSDGFKNLEMCLEGYAESNFLTR